MWKSFGCNVHSSFFRGQKGLSIILVVNIPWAFASQLLQRDLQSFCFCCFAGFALATGRKQFNPWAYEPCRKEQKTPRNNIPCLAFLVSRTRVCAIYNTIRIYNRGNWWWTWHVSQRSVQVSSMTCSFLVCYDWVETSTRSLSIACLPYKIVY